LKEKERSEKKAAKAEKERKEKESQEKAKSIMASFFGKPKASSSTTSPSKGPTPSTSNTSDFDRVFRPFTIKKDAELAPINWIQDAKRRKLNADADVIVIDEDDTWDRDDEMIACEPSPNTGTRGSLLFSPG
jgi:chromatin assembly factor 1 subunit A